MKDCTFEYNRIMREVALFSLHKDFIRGKVRVPDGVKPTDLKRDINIFFANVYRRGEWIYYNTPRK